MARRVITSFERLKPGQCFRWRRGGQRAVKRAYSAYRYETDDQTRHVRPGMYTRNVDVVSCPDSLQGAARRWRRR